MVIGDDIAVLCNDEAGAGISAFLDRTVDIGADDTGNGHHAVDILLVDFRSRQVLTGLQRPCAVTGGTHIVDLLLQSRDLVLHILQKQRILLLPVAVAEAGGHGTAGDHQGGGDDTCHDGPQELSVLAFLPFGSGGSVLPGLPGIAACLGLRRLLIRGLVAVGIVAVGRFPLAHTCAVIVALLGLGLGLGLGYGLKGFVFVVFHGWVLPLGYR